jgi:thymidylate synthase (FAD)
MIVSTNYDTTDPLFVPCLDHGFVYLVDHMGDDTSIVQAARVSYGAGTKSIREDRGLIRYLFRHRHCYHPSMEALTINGWKRWDQCDKLETFLVPDPTTRSYKVETLDVLSFEVNDEMLYTFENERMSYRVTGDHKMWFKGKYQKNFSKIAVQEMPVWGWFDPLTDYTLDIDQTIGDGDDRFRFIGFFLGDGSGASPNRISFHMKKQRKQDYLVGLLSRLGLEHSSRPSPTHGDEGVVIYVTTPSFLRQWVDPDARAADKGLLKSIACLTSNEALGLFDGLANSDGSASSDRERLSFGSTSTNLVTLFCGLAQRLGFDAHLSYETDLMKMANAYPSGKTTLESRKQYHSRETYTGKVYCATTSTGLLAVRGNSHKFGFVCGNTSPIEMCEVKFHIRCPIFVMRQLVRHRTASLNEYSGRYSIMTDDFYVPEFELIQSQSKDNKQGRAGDMSDDLKHKVQEEFRSMYATCYDSYENLLGPDGLDGAASDIGENFPGIAREVARAVLPVGNYTELYWKQNLHNLFHLLTLRLDSHAQKEIRVFADAMYDLIQPIFPIACEAFLDYQKNAILLSRMEVNLTKALMAGQTWFAMVQAHGSEKAVAEKFEMSKRELDEFKERFGL